MDFRVCLEYGSGYGVFCLKIYQNNIYFIFKKLSLISAHQNDLKTLKN